MAYYQSIFAIQDPFEGGVDDNAQINFFVNFNYVTSDSTAITADLLTHLQNNSIGTIGTNLFVGPKPIRPSAEHQDPITVVNLTGGAGPLHAMDLTTIRRGSFQVNVRSSEYLIGKAKIDAIFSLLDQTVNTTIP